MSASFVHLHTHSHYSLLDSTNRLDDLAAAVRRLGMTSCALTDHGNMFGAIEFYRACSRHAIKPIIGCEVYVAPEGRSREESAIGTGRTRAFHLTLLAANADGYRNLIQLSTIGFTEGFQLYPRVDLADLDAHHEGIIALSGCLEGEVAQRFLDNDEAGAMAAIRRYREIFGRDQFFLELMDHGMESERRLLPFLMQRSAADAIPAVATNDVHYLERADAPLHDALLCIGTRHLLTDPDRPRYGSDEYYLKSPDEMRRRFAYAPDVITRTREIADRVDLSLSFDHHYLPAFPIPLGSGTEAEYLEHLASDGLARRLKDFPGAASTVSGATTYHERLARELSVICSKGFAGYFLIVADFIAEARRRDIPVGPGRGSAAGSLVAWALGITTVDPLEYGLIFERFLNPERTALPDIDVDVCPLRREEVIEYVRERYGHDRVAQIITFGTFGARAVVRDVSRIYNLDVAETERLARLVPEVLRLTLTEALEKVPDLAAAAAGPHAALFATARGLEGLARHASRHAAGVVIANVPITEVTPLYRDADGHVVTQYDMDSIDKLGLLKMDILGLKTLTVLDVARRAAGVADFEAATAGLDDPRVFEMLSGGHALGVFQLDSTGIRELLAKVRPSKFEDLAALIALYRPGPMALADDFAARKHGRAPITVAHPALAPILAETYGVILYQEQVMEIAHRLAGFSLAQADELRHAMGKKIPEKMSRLRSMFVAGAVKNGLDTSVSETIADLIERFAGYGFNKSHAVAYAVIAYRSAWLKVHHTVAFLAALLSGELGDRDKTALYVAECRRLGIEILPPHVNAPSPGFEPAGPMALRVGIAAVKGVGVLVGEELVKARGGGNGGGNSVVGGTQEDLPFTTLWDLLMRVDTRTLNRRAIEALIAVGALDGLGPNRRSLLAALPALWDRASGERRSALSGQMGLFGELESAAPATPELPEFTDLTAREMEHLGFYLGRHPLLQRFPAASLLKPPPLSVSALVWNIGLVTAIEPMRDKRGRPMARLRIETLTGQIEVVVFSSQYDRALPALSDNALIAIRGRCEGPTKVVAQDLLRVEEMNWEALLTLPENASGDAMHELEILLASTRPGTCRIRIDLPRGDQRFRISSPHKLTLTYLMEKICVARLAEVLLIPVFPSS